MRARNTVPAFVVLIGLGAVVSCNDSESPPADPASARGSEIQEEERIPVEAKIGEQWVMIHPTADGTKSIARLLCQNEVKQDKDSPCSDSESRLPVDSLPTRDGLRLSLRPEYDCQNAACHARKENCAGAFFEEMASSFSGALELIHPSAGS